MIKHAAARLLKAPVTTAMRLRFDTVMLIIVVVLILAGPVLDKSYSTI